MIRSDITKSSQNRTSKKKAASYTLSRKSSTKTRHRSSTSEPFRFPNSSRSSLIPFLMACGSAEPPKAPNNYVRWLLGNHIFDHDIALDVVLSLSKRKLFYSWPSLSVLQEASSLAAQEFIDACSAEWEHLRGITGPSVLQILDQERWDRLGKLSFVPPLKAGRRRLAKRSICSHSHPGSWLRTIFRRARASFHRSICSPSTASSQGMGLWSECS